MNDMRADSLEYCVGDARRVGQTERRQSHRRVATPTFDQHIAAFFPYPRGNSESLATTTRSATERRLSATTPAANLQRRRQERDG